MARREDYLLSRLLLTDGTVTFEQLSKVLMQWGEDSPLSLLQIVQDEKLISEEEGRWLMTSISKLCEQEESSSLASLDSILCQLIIKQNLISAETVNEYQRRISERGLRSSVSEALLRDGLIQPETFSNLRRISERIFYRRKIWALVRGKERLAGIFYSPGRDYDITQVQEASTMTSKDLTGLQKLVHDTKGLVATQNFTKPARRRGKELPPIFGHYEIIEEIASGGMGTVYKARHEDSEGIVALKVLHDEESSVEKVQRFKREAEATKKLKHPNIVGIYDIGVVDGRHYFTMDYIDGVPLNVLIKEAKIELEDCLNIIQGIARALHYAHGKGVIHRDIKPANVIIDLEGRPQIMDFGLAKVLDTKEKLTRSDTIIGTPFYMAPEQTRGENSKIGPQTDIWAMGVILYEMITKKMPFMGRAQMELYHKINHVEPTEPRKLIPTLPIEVEYIIKTAMEKDIIDRYKTAEDIADDIEKYLDGKPIQMKKCPKWIRPVKKWFRSNKYIILVSILAIILGLIVASILTNTFQP